MNRSDVFFAMPLNKGQLSSGQFKSSIKISKIVNENSPILINDLKQTSKKRSMVIKESIHEIKAMLNTAKSKNLLPTN